MHDASNLADLLRALPGVYDVVVADQESTIYLRINKAQYHEGSAELLMKK